MRRIILKPYLFAILFSALLAFSSYAQDETRLNRLEIGIEGGPSIISVWGYNIDHSLYDIAIGGTAGVWVQKKAFEHIRIKTGIYFELKGVNRNDKRDWSMISLSDRYTVTRRLSYITIPILAKIHVDKKERLFFNIGPYFSYLLDVKETFTDVESGDTNSQDITEKYDNIDWGLSIGTGASIPLNQSFRFKIELRDNIGLYDIALKANARNNSLNLLVGLSYGFK